MSEIQIGRAICWGINSTVTWTGVATASFDEIESMDLTDDPQIHITRDRLGETLGIRAWDQKLSLTLNVYPCSDIGAGAIAAAKAHALLPPVLSLITIVGAGGDAHVTGAVQTGPAASAVIKYLDGAKLIDQGGG